MSRALAIRVGVVAASMGALIALAVGPAASDGARVTRGDFSVFAAGVGVYNDIAGHAQMVRTASGTTIVTVHISGLLPNTTYASHVHKQACSVGEADGHYQREAGSASPPNEIWPGPFTTDDEGVANGKATVDYTAGSDAVSVVVHAPGDPPNKIACADLA